MLNISENTEEFNPLKLDFASNPDPPNWIVKVMVASWFLGLISLFIVYEYTDISFFETVQWFVIFALAFTLIPYKWTVKILPVEFHFMVVINIVGIGPLLTSLFLIVNLAFSSNPVTETKKILDYHHGKEGFAQNDVIIVLEDKTLQNHQKFRSYASGQYANEVFHSSYFTYTVSDGLFGYKVLNEFEFE